MAIQVSFNGATILKPGAYSKSTVDLGGDFPLGPSGLVAVIGEADAGTPGASEINLATNRFTGDQMSTIRSKYRSGPIVDVSSFLFAPAADAAIPNGASVVWFYKTNASTRASHACPNSYGTVRALEWGVGGNRVSYTATAVAEVAPFVTSGAITFGDGTPLNAASFSVRLDGGALTVVTLSNTKEDHDTYAHLATELGTLMGVNFTVTAPGGTAIKIAHAADATANRDGWGKSIELVDSTPGKLAVLGLVAGITNSTVEPAMLLTLNQKRDQVTESDTVGGNIVLTIGRSTVGSPSSATVTIDANSVILNESGSPAFTLSKASYTTIQELAADISMRANWTAAVTNVLYGQLPLSVLDRVTTVGALTSVAGRMPARIKKDAFETQDFFSTSIMAELVSPVYVGLPDAEVEVLLAGGAKGATTSADIVAALAKFEKFHVNFVLPLFSRDATADAADGLTEGTSSYTIAGIHQAVKTHVSMMKTTKKRSERQAFLSLKDTWANVKTTASNLADGRMQLVCQDVRQVDAAGNIKWFQPWALASLLCGARCGSPIGTPMTFKFLNCSGIRQTAQAMTTPEADIVIDFDPDLQTDEAIQAGVTFLENPTTGGYRVVVDNTTYGVDNNFVWNRGNVIYAGDSVAYNFRNQMEALYVGKKNTVSVADIMGSASSILAQFLAQGITVATPDAPQGFKSLSVRLVGNTIYVSFIVKIVEGIDFVLTDITIQRATA